MFTVYNGLINISKQDPNKLKLKPESAQLARVVPALKGIEHAKLYMFDFNIQNDFRTGKAIGLDHITKRIALPYQHVFLGSIADWDKNQIVLVGAHEAYRVNGIYVYETSPTELEIVYQYDQLKYGDAAEGRTVVTGLAFANTNFYLDSVNSLISEKPTTAAEILKIIETAANQELDVAKKMDLIARWYVTYYLVLLQRKIEVGYGKIQIKYRDRAGRKHIDKRPFRVLNLGTKQQRQDVEKTISHHIEWTFKFAVRGHWRQIHEQVIGKDRGGYYNTKGYTWVKEHVRGDKDKDLAETKPTLIKLPKVSNE